MLTLKSGSTCKVRRMTARDSIAFGYVPDALAEDSAKKPNETDKRRQAVILNEIVLCDCTGRITRKDGTSFKVVRKPFDELSDSEQNVDLFACEPDAEEILSAVMELSGLGKADKEAVRPFPEESGISSPVAQDIDSIQKIAV